MRGSFRYLGRGSWLARRDPRVLILAALIFVIGAIQLRDARHLGLALGVALLYYSLARIPWRHVRAQWAYLLVVIGLFAGLNVVLTGGLAGGFADVDPHVIVSLPVIGAPITAEGLSLAVSQILRFAAIAAIGFPIAYAVAPGDFGVAFRQLGLGDRLAVALDLTLRFVPALGQQLSETVDAQRVRGYDPTAGGLNPVTRVRRFAPVLVPVTISALVDAEDTIDAMDLRGFGTGRRTWYRQLRFDRADRVLLGAFFAFAALATALNVLGLSDHYLLPFLVPGR